MQLKKFSLGQLFAKLGFHPSFWENVSEEPSLNQLIDKEYELLEPLFLVKMGSIYCLEPPGRFEGVPVSIEDYNNHPKDWWTTERYRRAIEPLLPDPKSLHQIIGIVPAGVLLKIGKITYKKGGVFGGRLTVFASIEDPKFHEYQHVCCGTLMQGLVGDEPRPKPRPHLIKQIESRV